MKQIFFLLALSILTTAYAQLDEALTELTSQLSAERSAELTKLCASIYASIQLAPPNRQAELLSLFEQKLRTYRTDNSTEQLLREFAETQVAPSVEEYPSPHAPTGIDERHLKPVYRVLGVLSCCAVFYFFVAYLRNSRSRSFLQYKRWTTQLKHDTSMVNGLDALTSIAQRRKP